MPDISVIMKLLCRCWYCVCFHCSSLGPPCKTDQVVCYVLKIFRPLPEWQSYKALV